MTFELGLSVGLVVGVVMGMFVMAGMIAVRQDEICPRCSAEMVGDACPYCGYEMGDSFIPPGIEWCEGCRVACPGFDFCPRHEDEEFKKEWEKLDKPRKLKRG